MTLSLFLKAARCWETIIEPLVETTVQVHNILVASLAQFIAGLETAGLLAPLPCPGGRPSLHSRCPEHVVQSAPKGTAHNDLVTLVEAGFLAVGNEVLIEFGCLHLETGQGEQLDVISDVLRLQLTVQRDRDGSGGVFAVVRIGNADVDELGLTKRRIHHFQCLLAADTLQIGGPQALRDLWPLAPATGRTTNKVVIGLRLRSRRQHLVDGAQHQRHPSNNTTPADGPDVQKPRALCRLSIS
mmetsp:Transcript_39411/g.64027  ORF Transcript_39411/g.64027 Transcript_39411/m.64027 type:complete len:242 (-) Transcript_39411:31-756(-)